MQTLYNILTTNRIYVGLNKNIYQFHMFFLKIAFICKYIHQELGNYNFHVLSCICVYIHIYVCVCVCVYVYVYMYVYIYMCVYVCMCMRIYIYIYISICVYMCMYIYIYIYIYSASFSVKKCRPPWLADGENFWFYMS